MKLWVLLMVISVNCFALGDPHFLPSSPSPKLPPKADAMIDTTSTLNQIERDPQKQEDPRKDEEEKEKKPSKKTEKINSGPSRGDYI